MPGGSTRAPRPYEAFVYGNSADEPTRAQIADAAEWHRAKLQGLLALKLQLTNRGGDIHLVDDLHLVVRLKSRLTTRAKVSAAFQAWGGRR